MFEFQFLIFTSLICLHALCWYFVVFFTFLDSNFWITQWWSAQLRQFADLCSELQHSRGCLFILSHC